MGIEINNESGAEVDEPALAQLSRFVLDEMGVNPQAELSIVLLDPDAMAALHEQWMDLPGPTDVMAFPMDVDNAPPLAEPPGPAGMGADHDPEPDSMLGDVVLCPVVAGQQAVEAGHSTASELTLLTTHGILHLLGYDHGDPTEEREMFDLQASLVNAWVSKTGREPVRTPLPGTGGQKRA
ncbi:rRNA maturation RNase YbeY [Jatrophihabitans sp. YIM 134969]